MVWLNCIQKALAQLAVAVRWPRHKVSLAVWWSQGIIYDPVFAVGYWVSCHMGTLLIIFLTASMKFGFWSVVRFHYCLDDICLLSSWTVKWGDLISFPLSPLGQPIVNVWQSHGQLKIISTTIWFIRKDFIFKNIKSINKYKLLRFSTRKRVVFLGIPYILHLFDSSGWNIVSLLIGSWLGKETKQ